MDQKLISSTSVLRLIISSMALSGFLISGCASLSKRNSETDVANKGPVDPTQQKIESLSTTMSKMQGRIEELEAKLAAMSDSMESTKTTVENIAGPKEVKTTAVGSNADGVPELPDENSPETHGKTKQKHEPLVENADDSISTFTKAMNLYRKSNFSDAVLGFNHFVELFPDHTLAGSAQFYAAESYLMMNEFKLALSEYKKVLSSFPNCPRTPAAMVRISHVYQALGDQKEAKRMLASVTNLYPDHPVLDWAPPAAAKAHTKETQATENNRHPDAVAAAAESAIKVPVAKEIALPLEATPMEPELSDDTETRHAQ